MTRRRLLVLASTFPGAADDGTPAFVRDLARREAEHFDTLVVVPRVPGAPAVERDGRVVVRRFAYFPRRWEDLADGAIIENLRAQPARYAQVLPFLLAEAWAVRRAVRTVRPDVMHVHWILPQGLVAAAVAPRVPKVVTSHGGDLYAVNAAPFRLLKRWVLRGASAVTVVNEQMRSAAVALGADPGTTHVMPMGADLDAVVPRRPGTTGTLLFVGRLVEKKGLAVLLRALRDLPADLRYRLVVVGDGPDRAAMERLAADLPVDFVGRLGRSEVMTRLAESDVVVVPSVLAASGDQDGLPVALLEAMGSGCAVVASDLPGINEAVEDGVSGRLVPPGDHAALAAALADVVADPARRAAMGAAAAERALQFSVRGVGERYVELLRRVIGDA